VPVMADDRRQVTRRKLRPADDASEPRRSDRRGRGSPVVTRIKVFARDIATKYSAAVTAPTRDLFRRPRAVYAR